MLSGGLSDPAGRRWGCAASQLGRGDHRSGSGAGDRRGPSGARRDQHIPDPLSDPYSGAGRDRRGLCRGRGGAGSAGRGHHRGGTSGPDRAGIRTRLDGPPDAGQGHAPDPCGARCRRGAGNSS